MKALAALLALALPALGQDLRGPYLVSASSIAAQACWRLEGLDSCLSLTGLLPGATFSYSLPGSTKAWTGRALPAPDQALRFAAFGDSGWGNSAQRRVAEVLERSDPHLALLLGDIVYHKGADKDYDEKYFRPYARLLSRLPFYPAVGNHDYGFKDLARGRRRFEEAYQRVFRKPPFYSFDAGPVHFVALDTNEAYEISAAAPIGRESAQRRWLEEDLKAAKAPWKIVFMHVPLYSIHDHGDNASLRASLEDLLQRQGVDVVLAGHDHEYLRSKPMGGIAHLIVGTGGAPLHWGGAQPEWLEKRLSLHGFLRGEADRASLLLEFVDERGEVRDSLRLEKADPGEK